MRERLIIYLFFSFFKKQQKQEKYIYREIKNKQNKNLVIGLFLSVNYNIQLKKKLFPFRFKLITIINKTQ